MKSLQIPKRVIRSWKFESQTIKWRKFKKKSANKQTMIYIDTIHRKRKKNNKKTTKQQKHPPPRKNSQPNIQTKTPTKNRG